RSGRLTKTVREAGLGLRGGRAKGDNDRPRRAFGQWHHRRRSRKRWARSTDPVRAKVRTEARTTPPTVRTEQDAVDAITLIRRVLTEEGADSTSTIDFGMARTAETILKAREREL
ncbi:unnamed protein product, partial [Phaeothamnion confervicola]